MEESPKEKLISSEKMDKVRNNIKSEEQILPETNLEKLFCCCCLDYNLTKSEYKSYLILKKKITPSYDENNEEHEKILSSLFSKTKELLSLDTSIDTTKISTKESNNSDDEKIWRKIGFQTGNPRTDFRAGGIFSLDLMNYFVDNHKNEYINIINEDYFTFALVCIRLSYLIRIYLYLLPSEEIRKNLKYQKNILATRKELKNFCYFLYDNNNFLLDIACVGIQFIYKKYTEQKKEGNKEINYFIIDPIILSSIQCLKETFNDINSNDDFISELKKNYRKNFLKGLKL
jgi:hypothetical protein